MAFILKSSKFIHSLIDFSCQRAVRERGKNVICSKVLRSCVIKNFFLRTCVSLAAKEDSNFEDLEGTLYRLNGDIRNKRVLLEQAKEVFELIKQKGEITDPQTMILLKCCSEASFTSSPKERLKFAEEIWKTALDFDTNINVNHFNALLSVFLENNHPFSPSDFLNKLKDRGIEPNLVTYKRFLKVFCKRGDIEGASTILEKMKELNFPLSEEDFNALVQCHCELGDFDRANEILNIMREKEVEPTSKTYTNILCGFAKHGKIDNLKEMLEQLPGKDIYLNSGDFLEIIYKLAINNYSEHIDTILERLTDNYEFSKNTNIVIHRLLHQRKDSVAMQVFEKEGEGQSLDYIASRAKFILKHFALYRSPKETLDMCKNLESKGLGKSAVGFALRQVIRYKNEEDAVSFLQAMQKRGVEVRSHYFWPTIIRASEKGNEKMLQVLKAMPMRLMLGCLYTTTRVVFPNYKFSDDWLADNGVLRKVGLPQKWLSVCFIEKLVMEEKLEEVERVASSFPVDIERYNNLLNVLFDFVHVHPEEIDRFVNILYCFAHDFHLKSYKTPHNMNELLPETAIKSFFDISVVAFSKTVRDEQVFEEVLKKMLERKFRITTEAASAVNESPKVRNLSDLVNKLTDPELQFDFDDKLLKLKAHVPANTENDKKARFKTLNGVEEINVKALWKELETEGSYLRSIFVIRNLIRMSKYEDAFQLMKILPILKESTRFSTKKSLFLYIIQDLCERDRFDLAEKAFYEGVEMDMLSMNDYVSYVRLLLPRGGCSLAVEKYCSHIEKTRNVARCLEFLIKVVGEGSEEDFERVATTLSSVLNKDLLMTYLVIAFADNGELKKAKKVLETKKFRFLERRFYTHCELRLKLSSSKELENYLKLVKDVEFFDRVPLYKLIIKKYADEENIENLKQLWLLIEEDDISDFCFLEQMRDLVDDPSLSKLKEIAGMLQETELSFHPEIDQMKELLDRENFVQAFKVASTENVQIHRVQKLSKVFAGRGNVYEVAELISKYPLENYIGNIAVAFLKNNKVSEYFEFLNYYIMEKNFNIVVDCFDLQRTLDVLQKNNSLFETYKSLVIRCFEEGGLELPLNSLFVSCLIIPNLEEEAEKLLDRYPNHFRIHPFHDIYKMSWTLFQEMNFYLNLTSSKKLKSHFSQYLPFIYSRILQLNCEKNDLEGAIGILDTAVSENVGESLRKKSICTLKEMMENKGMDFPYPELVESEK